MQDKEFQNTLRILIDIPEGLDIITQFLEWTQPERNPYASQCSHTTAYNCGMAEPGRRLMEALDAIDPLARQKIKEHQDGKYRSSS